MLALRYNILAHTLIASCLIKFLFKKSSFKYFKLNIREIDVDIGNLGQKDNLVLYPAFAQIGRKAKITYIL